MATKAAFMHKLWCQFCIALNLFSLFAGILKNPGIPQAYIDRILKEEQGKGEQIELEDMESGSTPGETTDVVASESSHKRHTGSGGDNLRGPTTPVKRGNIWCFYC